MESGRCWHRKPWQGVIDVRHVSFAPSPTKDYIVQRYLNEHPGEIPVSSQSEIDRYRGCKTRVVPAPLRDLLRSMHEFVFDRKGDPSERLAGFEQAFGHQLNAEGRRELKAIVNESVNWS